MSFYASSPTPTSDPTSSSAHPAAWPAALDQLILQQAHSAQMGALRRQSSTVTDPLPPELPNYAPSQENDRLLFEAFENQQLPRNTARQSVPNQPDPSTPQTSINDYRQTWERPGMGINGCNVANLPQEAFQMANDLSLDTAPVEDFASRGKHASPVGLNPYLQRLMNFHEEQQQSLPNRTLENFWKPLFATYFAPDATMHMDIKSENTQELRSIKLPVEALPRIWKSKFDAGVREERLLMENPCEFLYTNGYVVVDCQKTVVLTKYEHSTVITNGHLRVYFYRDKKIMSWRFSPRNHQELFLRTTLRLGVPPPSAISEFGMPSNIVRLMYIAEDIGGISAKIETEVSRLLSGSSSTPQQQSHPRQQEQKPVSSYAGISKGESNGNAYRAILSQLSQLDGVQGMHLDDAFGDAPVGNAGTGPGGATAPMVQGLVGTVVQGLQNNLAADLRQSTGNGDPNTSNMRNSMTSWRPDQASDVFSNIFDDSMRPSFVQREADLAARGAVQNQDDLDAKRQIASSLAEAQAPQGGHSVVDAVAAAASGQGGWGVGSTGERNFRRSEQHGGELGSSLQLLNAVPTDGTLNLQSGCEAPGNDTVGQSAPPGLSIFTPQSEQREKTGKSQTGRRKSQNTTLRDVRSSSNRPAGNGNHKNYNGVRSNQRMPSNRLKRGNQTGSVPNASDPSRGTNVMGVSQGVSTQNGGTTTKGNSPGGAGKPVKESAQGTTGARRSSQRNSGSDAREKRQKTSQGGNQT